MPRFGDVIPGTIFGDSNAYSTFVSRQDLNDIIGVLLGLLQIEEHINLVCYTIARILRLWTMEENHDTYATGWDEHFLRVCLDDWERSVGDGVFVLRMDWYENRGRDILRCRFVFGWGVVVVEFKVTVRRRGRDENRRRRPPRRQLQLLGTFPFPLSLHWDCSDYIDVYRMHSSHRFQTNNR